MSQRTTHNNYSENPCLSCGACCAYFRASFYWAEGDDATENGVPVNFTTQISPFRRMMTGTSGVRPRCIALTGTIGEAVRCSIHSRRPSVCRDFAASWLHGVPNPRCDEARQSWELTPLLSAAHDSQAAFLPRAA